MQANNAIVKKTGWRPIISLDVGLKRTVNWYKNFCKIYIDKKSTLKDL